MVKVKLRRNGEILELEKPYAEDLIKRNLAIPLDNTQKSPKHYSTRQLRTSKIR